MQWDGMVLVMQLVGAIQCCVVSFIRNDEVQCNPVQCIPGELGRVELSRGRCKGFQCTAGVQ